MRARVPGRGIPGRTAHPTHREDQPHRGRGGARLSLVLDDAHRAGLQGALGAGRAFSMQLVVRAAEVVGARRLIPITRAHLDSCLYHGQASLDFVRAISAEGARVSVPTSLNVGGVDLLHPELWQGTREELRARRDLMEAYRALGCTPTFTCAPYQVPAARPTFGEQVAWGESNAIAFCNAVIGARTNRYGDFIDAACAVAGAVPDAGLHQTDARRGRLVLRLGTDVPASVLDDDSFYPILGLVVGRRSGTSVPVLDGLPSLSENRLKAIAAAAASSGSVAMFHVVGSTPEAPTLTHALHGQEADAVEAIQFDELRAARRELMPDGDDTPLRAVSLGTPHASMEELRRIAALLGGRAVTGSVEMLVSTSRDVLALAEDEGVALSLRAAGAELLVDTCSYIAPILRPGDGAVMTDSGKWAYYAPGNVGARVVFGSTAECVASAVAGRVVRTPSAWDRP